MKSELTQKIVNWAEEKGIFMRSNNKAQFIKLIEEVGELSSAIQKDDIEQIEDGIGDCVVVLTILAEMYDLSIDNCVQSAYDVIAKRSGKMVDGIFVKDK
jgi:NTP pyrophosphatase (non-canonical NTP hydrolase)